MTAPQKKRVGGWREPWSQREVAVLKKYFPIGGAAACKAQLKKLEQRGSAAIEQKAWQLRIRGPSRPMAFNLALEGERLDRAIELYEKCRLFSRVAREFDISETAAMNCILIALCHRRGFIPAARDENGKILPAEVDRMRLMMQRGRKGVDIMLEMGVSAGCVRYQRRRYEAYLERRSKTLPPPGGGQRYSGAPLTAKEKREVEMWLLRGFGTPRIGERTGVSNTAVKRIRAKLVAKLRRRGECLPGCDIDGHRLRQVDHPSHKTPQQIAAARTSILAGDPLQVTATKAGMSKATVSTLRAKMKVELAAEGKALPPTTRKLPTIAARAMQTVVQPSAPKPMPKRPMPIPVVAPIARIDAAPPVPRPREAAGRRLTFEEQLAAVAAGAALVDVRPIRRPPTEILSGSSLA